MVFVEVVRLHMHVCAYNCCSRWKKDIYIWFGVFRGSACSALLAEYGPFAGGKEEEEADSYAAP